MSDIKKPAKYCSHSISILRTQKKKWLAISLKLSIKSNTVNKFKKYKYITEYLQEWHNYLQYHTSLWRSSFLFLLSSLARSRSDSTGPSMGSGFFFGTSSSIPSFILTGAARLLTVGLALTSPCFPNFSESLLQTYRKFHSREVEN